MGRNMQNNAKITDPAIIERERFLAPRNSPRYAKIGLDAPEMLEGNFQSFSRDLQFEFKLTKDRSAAEIKPSATN